jgi:hypothetical protein
MILFFAFSKNIDIVLGNCNGNQMFVCLGSIVKDYNDSGQEKAALQEYDAYNGKAFILCIVTNLMCKVHEKIPQVEELYYMNASASFK